MQTLNDFPDIGRTFQIMKLRDKLNEADSKSLIGFSIHHALELKRPVQLIAKMIMDQYRDNPLTILGIVDQETIDLIKSIYP